MTCGSADLRMKPIALDAAGLCWAVREVNRILDCCSRELL